MEPRRAFSTVTASLVAHATIALAAVWLRPPKVDDRARPPLRQIELDLAAPPERPRAEPTPPPAPAPETTRPPTPSTPQPEAARPQPRALARTIVRDRVNDTVPEGAIIAPGPAVEPSQGTVEPGPSTPAPPVMTGPPAPGPISAADLYRNVDTMSAQAAADGHVDLGRPGGTRPSRSLFNRGPTGSPEDRAREAALAPTMAALEESRHMQAPGTARHSRIVSRRAEESFETIATIPGIGSAVMRAPTRTIPPIQQSAGRATAAGDALDQAHAGSFTMMNIGSLPTSYHVLRAEVEVEQDAGGAIVGTPRVVTSSRVPAFDAAAISALREALPEAPVPRTTNGRFSRWSFEVSDATGQAQEAVLGGNEGWRVLPGSNGGVRLRMRVRMVTSRLRTGT